MAIIIVISILASSCRTATLRSDQVDLRLAVIKLYQEQVFDNAVRAYRREPMLLLTYSALQGTVTTKTQGVASATKTALDNTFGAPAGVGNITDADTLATAISITLNRDVTLTVKGDPVSDTTVYNAFIDFAAKPGSILHGPTAPESTADYVMLKRYGDEYYWIPSAKRAEFFNMYNQTALRFNPSLIFNRVQELFDLADSPSIQSVQ